MSYNKIVGLNVIDQASYQRYRDEMTPILLQHGGRFIYDFTIEKTLTSISSKPITRLFVISFPDQSSQDNFFKSENYLEIRKRWFVPAVDGITSLGNFELAKSD